MKVTEQERKSQRSTILFGIHTGIFALMWVGALTSSFSPWFGVNPLATVGLIWSLFYILHTRSYLKNQLVRSDESEIRQAYREGYKDAMREAGLMSVPDRRVWLDDEGELYQEEEQSYDKQKRR